VELIFILGVVILGEKLELVDVNEITVTGCCVETIGVLDKGTTVLLSWEPVVMFANVCIGVKVATKVGIMMIVVGTTGLGTGILVPLVVNDAV